MSVVFGACEYAVADAGEGEPSLHSRLWNERVGGEARRGVEFKHIATPERRHAEVDTRNSSAADGLVGVYSDLLHLLRELAVFEEGVARFVRVVFLVIAVPAVWRDDLEYGKRFAVNHADGEFATRNELLDEDCR